MRPDRWMNAAVMAGLLGAVALSAEAALGQPASIRSAPMSQQPVPTAVTTPARAPLPATNKLFDSYVASHKLPGIVGAFGIGDAPTMFISSGRIADEPGAAAAGPDSLWRVYSMTKPVTAVAAMILIERGRIKLDEPVSDFIPGFAHMRVQNAPDTIASHAATHPITIRNLLTHTAGLGYNIITKGPLLKEYERLGIIPGQISASTEAEYRRTRPTSLAEFADRVATLPLIAEPGSKWSYSIGLDVMGRVVEVASGMPFDAFVQQTIFDPLGLTSSFWTVPAAAAGRLTTNYAFVGDNRVPVDPAATSAWLSPPSFPYGGAGLVMSARDYDRFIHMLQDRGAVDGVRILRPETAALMMSDLLPPGVTYGGAVAATGGPGAGPRMGYGAGGSVLLDDRPGGAARGTYAWGGAAGTIFWVDPVRRFRGTVMVNYFPSDRYPIREETARALLTDLSLRR